MDWFLYDNGPRHERVKKVNILLLHYHETLMSQVDLISFLH